jgi:predicted nucleic acid-binding protein
MSSLGPNALFVDTSGWAEPLLRNSPHYQAMDLYSQQVFAKQRPLVTTDDIISELVALVTARSSTITRAYLVQFVNQIRVMPQLQIIHIDERIWDEAWAMLERMTDKEWSLVDAASFVMMRRLGITEAFTSDQHFTQAGFSRVL